MRTKRKTIFPKTLETPVTPTNQTTRQLPDDNKYDVAIIGKVLYDVFPDGEEVLGGAPLNVAWSLKGFGLSPLLISRVGSDVRSQKLLDAMQAWGLSTDGIVVTAGQNGAVWHMDNQEVVSAGTQ